MSQAIACGLLMCRWNNSTLQYFLVHPGGPFFAKKDKGFWGIPKGMPESDEDYLAAAQREFIEETGIVSSGPYHPLSPIVQKAGKRVHAWTFIGDWNEEQGIRSNTFELEWPPKSGIIKIFPEQDKGRWFEEAEALEYILPAQQALISEARKIHSSPR